MKEGYMVVESRGNNPYQGHVIDTSSMDANGNILRGLITSDYYNTHGYITSAGRLLLVKFEVIEVYTRVSVPTTPVPGTYKWVKES